MSENTACLVMVKFGMYQFTRAWRNAVWELFMCKFTVKTPDFSDSEVPKWGLGPLGFGLKNFAELQTLKVFGRFRSSRTFTVTLRKLCNKKILVKTSVVPRKWYDYIIFSR